MTLPWGSTTLCLLLQLDLAAVPDAAAQRCKDHAAACAAACVACGLCPAEAATARAVLTSGAADLAAARALPFDAWHADAATHPLRIEFLYSTAAPRQLSLRMLNELPRLDGVSALRVALHMVEALEGTPLCASAAFKKNPPFVYTAAHGVRAAALAASTAAAAAWAWLRSAHARPADAAVPRSPAGLFAYYRAAAPPPARYRCYARAANAYKPLLAATQQWHDASQRHGFLNLINVPPLIMPSLVPRAEDIRSMERRYAGVLLPPAPPPMGPAWLLANHMHVGVLFCNNYGRHEHSFKAVATAFQWDWLGLAAPIAGFGALTVNGAFLAWVRGTPADMESCKGTFAAALGDAVGEHDQIPWPACAPAAAQAGAADAAAAAEAR